MKIKNIQQNQNVTRETLNPNQAEYWDARKEAFSLIRDRGESIWQATLQIYDCPWESEAERNEVYRCIEGWKEELRENPVVVEIYHALGCDDDMFLDCDKHPNLFRL